MLIFWASKNFPKEETYSLTDQIRRSLRSVCANLAEAWRKRRYKAAFISKLSDAESEAAETQVWIEFAMKCGYLERDQSVALYKSYDEDPPNARRNDQQTSILGNLAMSSWSLRLQVSLSPHLVVSVSPCLLVSKSPCLHREDRR
jgi:four helix bundle protein